MVTDIVSGKGIEVAINTAILRRTLLVIILQPSQPPTIEGSQWLAAAAANQMSSMTNAQTPSMSIAPAGMQNTPYSPGGVMFVDQAKMPYDVSQLPQQHKNSLKNHNLTFSMIPLTVIFGILVIGGSWFFGFATYLWSFWVLLRHRSIFAKLPRLESKTYMPSLLAWISWVPLLNFLIIPFSQDELRRQLNLQFSLREKMLPFSRSPIVAAAWTQTLAFLFALPLIVFASSLGALDWWDFSVISLFWHIPIILISILSLVILLNVTNKSQKSWWPNKEKESKSGRDLIGSTAIPLFVTLISVFGMMIIILPIYAGGGMGNSYFNDTYEMQMWVFFPCVLIVLFGLMSEPDYSKQNNNRGGVYSLYFVLLAAFGAVPFIFIVVMWIAMALMLAAFILMLIVEILIGSAVNNLGLDDSAFASQSATPQSISIAAPVGGGYAAPMMAQQPQMYAPQMHTQQAQPAQMDELTKTRKRFTKTQMFASGGMAVVFHCKDNVDGVTRVWKQAQGEHIPLNDANKRLKYEAEVLMTANHPRIPKYFGFTDVKNSDGKDENVLIMEFLEGGDLKATVGQVAKVGLSMPTDTIIKYLKEMCEPLVHMASLSEPIYHRDMKPHNVIVHPTRGPVIIDWGLAKAVQGGSDISVTRGGSGTWTSPERDSGISGPFTDVYSLGKILYYLATCKQPPAIISTAERDEMISSGHPTWLAHLMLQAAWPRHQERIQNVKAFLQVLVNQGESAPVEQAAESDDFTTWG